MGDRRHRRRGWPPPLLLPCGAPCRLQATWPWATPPRAAAPPPFRVVTLAANSGLTAPPSSYECVWTAAAGDASLWRPVPPPGFVVLGCVAGDGINPPPRGAAACVAASACIAAAIGQCLPVRPSPASLDGGHMGSPPPGGGGEDGGAFLWCIDNAAATFGVGAAAAPPSLAPFDLRAPLGASPASLAAAAAARASSLDRARRLAPAPAAAFSEFLEARRASLAAAARAGLRAAAADWRLVWWDAAPGTRGASRAGVSLWRPRPPPGYCALGDAAVAGRAPPRTVAVLLDGGGAGAGEPPLLAHAAAFTLVWRDAAAPRADRALALWRPVPPPGYVSLGVVAGVGTDPPPRGAARCVRADATAPAPPHALRVAARLPACGKRTAPLTLWTADDATCAVVVGPPSGAPPPSADAPVLTLGPVPTDASGGAAVVVHCDGVAADVADAVGRPLAALRLGALDAGARRAPGAASLQAYAGVAAELWTFNPGAGGPSGAWEPVVERAPLIVKADAGGGGGAGGAAINVAVKAACDTVRVTTSFAAAAALLRARGATSARRGRRAAPAAGGVRTAMVNALGEAADVLVLDGTRRELVSLPPTGDPVPALAPLPPPPGDVPGAGASSSTDCGAAAAADAGAGRVAVVVDRVSRADATPPPTLPR